MSEANVQAPAETVTPPTAEQHELAQQLCRYWADRSDCVVDAAPAGPGRLVFLDEGQEGKAHLYACALPKANLRHYPAASMIVGATEWNPGYGPIPRVAITVTAHARTRLTAVRMLRDLERILRPNGQPFVDDSPLTNGEQPRRGFIGAPPRQVEGPPNGITLWPDQTPKRIQRVLTVEIVSGPQELAIEGSTSATPEGGGSAQMTIAVRYATIEMPAPRQMFQIWHTGTGGIGFATIEVTGRNGGQLILTRATDASAARSVTTLNLDSYANVDLLRQAVHGVNGWTTDVPIDFVLSPVDRLATDLEYFAPLSAVGAENKRTLRVWA